MAETAGGLVKQSIQLTPEQKAWLKARADRRGRARIAAVIREIIDAAIEADAAPRAAGAGRGGPG